MVVVAIRIDMIKTALEGGYIVQRDQLAENRSSSRSRIAGEEDTRETRDMTKISRV